MRTLRFIFDVFVLALKTPFILLDFLVFDLPRERKAKKWRAVAKVGDKGYFINLLGGKTYFEIADFKPKDKKDRYRITTKSYASSSSQWTDLNGTYPDDRK